jgi:hypothetical protein
MNTLSEESQPAPAERSITHLSTFLQNLFLKPHPLALQSTAYTEMLA